MIRTPIASLIFWWCLHSAECDCNQKYLVQSSEVRYITSPAYSSNFTELVDCYYEISTSSSEVGAVAQVEVIDATLPCDDTRSKLTVYDGFSKNPRYLGQICQDGQATFESPKYTLYLTFRARAFSHPSRGFRLRVSARPKYSHCYIHNTLVLNATDVPDVIASPFYPYEMDQNVNCRWLLKASEGRRINATVLESNMKGSLDCSNFGLSVYDGKTSYDDALVARVCNNTRLTLLSSGSYLLVVFTSGYMVYHSGGGFQLQYRSVPWPVDDGQTTPQLIDQTLFCVIASVVLAIIVSILFIAVVKLFILPRHRKTAERRQRRSRQRLALLRVTEGQIPLPQSVADLTQLPTTCGASGAGVTQQTPAGSRQHDTHQCRTCRCTSPRYDGRDLLLAHNESGVLLALPASCGSRKLCTSLELPPSYEEAIRGESRPATTICPAAGTQEHTILV